MNFIIRLWLILIIKHRRYKRKRTGLGLGLGSWLVKVLHNGSYSPVHRRPSFVAPVCGLSFGGTRGGTWGQPTGRVMGGRSHAGGKLCAPPDTAPSGSCGDTGAHSEAPQCSSCVCCTNMFLYSDVFMVLTPTLFETNVYFRYSLKILLCFNQALFWLTWQIP